MDRQSWVGAHFALRLVATLNRVAFVPVILIRLGRLLRIDPSRLGWLLLSWSLHSAAFFLFVILLAGFSINYVTAATCSFFCVFALSFSRFSLFDRADTVAFLGGGVAATLWLPVSVAVLDWTVGGGASPREAAFFVKVFQYTYSSQVLAYTLAPAIALIGSDVLGFSLGIWVHRLLQKRRRASVRRAGDSFWTIC
jgi:hypothetical protein